MTNPEKLKETPLPPAQAFHNDLTCKEISDEEYQLCQRVSNMFNKRWITCLSFVAAL